MECAALGMWAFRPHLAFKDKKPTEMEDDDDPMARRKVEVSNVNFKADAKLIKMLRSETDEGNNKCNASYLLTMVRNKSLNNMRRQQSFSRYANI